MSARKYVHIVVIGVLFSWLGTGDAQAQPPAPGATAKKQQPGPTGYALGLDAERGVTQFGVLALDTGTFIPVADLPNSAQGLGRDEHGKLYLVDAANNLVRVNGQTGKTRIVGNTGVTTPGPLGPTMVDVFGSMATGELFLLDYANNLYSVDPKTGAATLIGPTGIPAITSPIYSSGFAGNCTSLFFTIDEVDENLNPLQLPTLYRIDPRTALATLVGPTAPFMPGGAFIDGQLYGFSLDLREFGFGAPQVFAIDADTGAATAISVLNVTAIFGAIELRDDRHARCAGVEEQLQR
jgi:hypothetical protein